MLKDIKELTTEELDSVMQDVWKLQAITETAHECAIQAGQGTLTMLAAASLDYIKAITEKIEPYL